MEWYFIFETEDLSLFAVLHSDKDTAIAMAYEITEFDGGCQLINELIANDMSDNMVDWFGLDVY